MSETQTIIWRQVDKPGHDSARLSTRDDGCELAGASVFAHEGKACRLDYVIQCDSQWQTRAARVTGWLATTEIFLNIVVDDERRWFLNGDECEEVAGCIDVDLNFSPVTNTLPIRRLKLGVGDEARVNAAWLRFPSFQLERLDQTYRRIDQTTYHYESGGGSFVRDLKVNEAGLVTLYPGFFEAIG